MSHTFLVWGTSPSARERKGLVTSRVVLMSGMRTWPIRPQCGLCAIGFESLHSIYVRTMIIGACAMILVRSHLSCGPQRSKNYIHNIPLALYPRLYGVRVAVICISFSLQELIQTQFLQKVSLWRYLASMISNTLWLWQFNIILLRWPWLYASWNVKTKPSLWIVY